MKIDKDAIKKYIKWNKIRYENRNDENIFPIGIEDKVFVDIIINIILGENWYVSYSAGREQVNEEALEAIIRKIGGTIE